ncbi:ABC transporter ATP-binding protein [Roseovarius sp. 2305UL8-3]|uniref:ABC transporter ATP-binding protein n=1 Tax=Roseovarius conchicola TaxID=3121636 RepID=UPI00352706A3
MSKPIISVRKAVKTYGSVRALDNIDLDIHEGEFLTLLGPSGSGKTTLLSAIAGFLSLTSGSIQARGSDITRLPPEKRDFAMVFQGYALFPTMTVAENVGYPLRVRKVPVSKRTERVRECLDLVQMSGFADRMPHQLSGGQQQRIALARALSFKPDVLLLDEPLSALDKKLRADLQWELKALHDRLGVTFIYVTHDQEEAMSMSDRVIILNDGFIQQEGLPNELYDFPKNKFVASFLGKSNFIPSNIKNQGNGRYTAKVAEQSFDIPQNPGSSFDGYTSLAIRPERIRMGLPGHECFTGRIRQVSYLGERCLVLVDHDAFGEILISQTTWNAEIPPETNLEISFGWDGNACVPIDEV